MNKIIASITKAKVGITQAGKIGMHMVDLYTHSNTTTTKNTIESILHNVILIEFFVFMVLIFTLSETKSVVFFYDSCGERESDFRNLLNCFY